jgi:PleD family two-component response regulator
MNPEIPEGQTQFQKMKDQYSALLADSTEIPAKENTTSPKTDDDSLFSEEDLKTVFGQNYPCKKLAPLKQNILIVEDDFYVRTLLKDILESEFEILMADDGESGLTMANKFDLDLILLDLIMPRMDGRGTLKRLRCNRKTSDVPIIIVSGAPSFGTSMEILASGANDFLQSLQLGFVRCSKGGKKKRLYPHN